jgi:hypothetical protein
MVSGKKAEQASPARAKAPTPVAALSANETSQKAAIISTGRAIQTIFAGTRTIRTETSSRPATSAPQKAERA